MELIGGVEELICGWVEDKGLVFEVEVVVGLFVYVIGDGVWLC